MLDVLAIPFLACLVLTGIHAYLGLHVLARGVIFVDLALAQIAALGATIAILAGIDPHGGGAYWISLAFTFLGDERVVVWRASAVEWAGDAPAGTVVDAGPVVACGEGALLLEEVETSAPLEIGARLG